MERPVEIIQRIRESAWEDGPLAADELDKYFDQLDDESLTSQQVADQQAARVVELEKERDEYDKKYDDLRTRYDKLLDKNYELMMNGGASSAADVDDRTEDDDSDEDRGIDYDDLDMTRRKD